MACPCQNACFTGFGGPDRSFGHCPKIEVKSIPPKYFVAFAFVLILIGTDDPLHSCSHRYFTPKFTFAFAFVMQNITNSKIYSFDSGNCCEVVFVYDGIAKKGHLICQIRCPEKQHILSLSLATMCVKWTFEGQGPV